MKIQVLLQIPSKVQRKREQEELILMKDILLLLLLLLSSVNCAMPIHSMSLIGFKIMPDLWTTHSVIIQGQRTTWRRRRSRADWKNRFVSWWNKLSDTICWVYLNYRHMITEVNWYGGQEEEYSIFNGEDGEDDEEEFKSPSILIKREQRNLKVNKD